MNGKQAKSIRLDAYMRAYLWLMSIVPEEEATKVNIQNFKNYMPKQTHIMNENQMRIMPHSMRWFIKQSKKNWKAS